MGNPTDVSVLDTLSASGHSIDATLRRTGHSDPLRVTKTPLPRLSIADVATSQGGDAEGADLEVIGVIGEGGMGRVLLARQHSVGREVAIKVPRAPSDEEALRAEAITMGRLEHPAIIPVHAIGVDAAGGLALVMHRVDGVAWATLLHEPQHPRWEQLGVGQEGRLAWHVEVLAQVATALHFAHGRGVVHRDVKPLNVLVGPLGEVYLADWGVASVPAERVAADGPAQLLGTPLYMAPEMVTGNPRAVGPFTDVYLLGATLHEVLTGRGRHAGDSVREVLQAALESAPPRFPPEVPSELAELVVASTQKEPALRPQSALEFRRGLEAWKAHRGALELVHAASATAQEVSALLAGSPVPQAGTGAPSLQDTAAAHAPGDIDTALAEARFAVRQALKAWPQSAAAMRVQREVLTLAVRHELSRGNLEAARAVCAQLEPVPDALAAQVEALAVQRAAQAAERAELEQLAHAQNFEVGSSERRALLGLVTTLVSIGATLLWVREARRAEPATGPEMLRVAAGTTTVILSLLFALRRRVARNEAGQKLLMVMAAAQVGIFVHRLVSVAAGAAVHVILAGDLVLSAAVVAAGAAVRLRLAWLSLPLLVAAAVAVSHPALATRAFPLGVIVVFVALLLGWPYFNGTRARSPL